MKITKIFAYFLYREFKLKQRWKPMLIAQILTPVVYFLFFGVAFSSNLQTFKFRGYEIEYITFLLPGIIVIQALASFNLVASMVSNERRWGIFRLLMVSEGNSAVYIGTKVTTEGIIVFLQTLALILIGVIISSNIRAIINPKIISYILFIVIISTIFWSNLGVILGLVLHREEKRELLFSLINLPILFCSSVFYDINQIPYWMHKIALVNPLTYCASSIRNTIFTGNLWSGDFYILLAITIFAGILSNLITPKMSLVP